MRFVFVFLAFVASAAADTCSTDDVCADVANSFIGTVISDVFAPPVSVALDWSTGAETVAPPQAPQAPAQPRSASSAATPYAYRVSRCNAAASTTCEWIAVVRAIGQCGIEQPYTVIDRSPEPPAVYRVEVLMPDGRVACSVDTVAQPAAPNY